MKELDFSCNNKCQTTNINYQAKVTASISNYNPKIYYGTNEGTVKSKNRNHKKYFCHEQHRKDRELSNEYWGFQQLNASPEISFSILKKRPPTRRKRACTYVYIKNFS